MSASIGEVGVELVRGWVGFVVGGCLPDEGTFKSEKHFFALL